MPIKYNLTKFDKIAEHIQEVAARKGSNPGDDDSPTGEDAIAKVQAIIITSLCSAYSYQTAKMISNGTADIGSVIVHDEYRAARDSRWKHLRNIDIQDVASMGVKDSAFYAWMHYNVGKDEHELYKKAWESLKKKFDEACDELEPEVERA